MPRGTCTPSHASHARAHAHVQQAQDQQRESLGRRDGPDPSGPPCGNYVAEACRRSAIFAARPPTFRPSLLWVLLARSLARSLVIVRDECGTKLLGPLLGGSQLVCLCIHGSTYGMLRPVILSILIRYIVATLPLCPRFFLRLVPCYISRTSSFIQLALYLLCPSVESKGTRNACRIPFVDGELWGTAPPRENVTEARPWSDSV